MAQSASRVLVVDDNEDVAQSFEMLLMALGYEVQTAGTGQEALRKADLFHPVAVLLDISLPDFDGYEVARRLRSAHPDEKMLLIAMSGFAPEDNSHAAEAGIDHHVMKPADVQELERLLSHV